MKWSEFIGPRVNTPHKSAIVLAFVISFFVLILNFIFFFADYIPLWIALVVSSLVFILTYFITKYIILGFILTKITPIYNVVSSLKVSDEELMRRINRNEYISEMDAKVYAWVKKKSKEISVLRANEAYRKEFLGNVMHELKTPVFNIQGYISTLLDGGLEDSEINTKYLERAEKNVNRMITIINDLTSISKLESGVLQLDYIDFNIITIIQDVFELHEILARKQQVILTIVRKYRGNLLVYADRQRIFEVISNLVLNSILYGREGGTTTVDLSTREGKVIVDITDDGIGIDRLHRQRIFERFYRVDKSRSRDVGGTGLGLAIVKHIIEAHGETISLKSKVNRGTTFTFSLQASKG